MRWLFFLMVAVNIAILIWGGTRESPTVATVDELPREVGDLRLLSRADIDRLKKESVVSDAAISDRPADEKGVESQPIGPSRQTLAEQSTSPPSSSGQDTFNESQASESLKSVRLGADGNAPEIPASESITMAEQSDSNGLPTTPTLPQPGTATVAQVDAIAEQLSQLSNEGVDNLHDRESEQSQTAPNPTVEPEPATDPPPICGTMGPIEDETLAGTVQDLFKSGSVAASLRSEESRKVTGYWVVLPTYNDYPAAIAAIKSLREQGVVDIQRFYRGELKDGVSLGIYNRRFNAEKRKSQIEEKGFSPEILPRHSTTVEYWIDYQHQGADETLERIARAHPQIEMADRECPAESPIEERF